MLQIPASFLKFPPAVIPWMWLLGIHVPPVTLLGAIRWA